MTSAQKRYPHGLSFLQVWVDLAEAGFCDAMDSQEFRRVFTAWLNQKSPQPIQDFIMREANQPARES